MSAMATSCCNDQYISGFDVWSVTDFCWVMLFWEKEGDCTTLPLSGRLSKE